jgi:BlaI family transcriptional regulator, penicillinase repressor
VRFFTHFFLDPFNRECYGAVVPQTKTFSRRERQIMDILFKVKRATATEVMGQMPDAPGYSAVRTLLATLERKGHVRHVRDGAKFVFFPVTKTHHAGRSAIAHLIQTFFDGSRGRAAAALLNVSPNQFSAEELDELETLIRRARKGETR